MTSRRPRCQYGRFDRRDVMQRRSWRHWIDHDRTRRYLASATDHPLLRLLAPPGPLRRTESTFSAAAAADAAATVVAAGAANDADSRVFYGPPETVDSRCVALLSASLT